MSADERARVVAPSWRGRGGLSHGDRIAVTLLVIAPILLYVPFTLAGRPVVPGDDLTQNYPLRELAGSLIRSGHLPTWDPFIWSGTPLLAGWNAGALYPGTWLFAVLPGVAAWTVNLILVGVISGTGVYVLLRLLRCGPLAAALGGMCFTYAGFMSGQFVHIGLVQGTGYVAWMLVAIELLVQSSSARTAIRPMLMLALSASLCVLAGEPRAISSAVVIVAVYLVARVMRLVGKHGLRMLAMVSAGTALGVGIAAIQWLPGLAFVSRSQRTLDSYQAFGTGSLPWTTIAHNLLVPFLLGGNGNFGTVLYQGGFNLPELTIGMGLLPLVAAFAYLPELCTQAFLGLRRLRRPRNDVVSGEGFPAPSPERALGVWYAMGIVGLVLTLGTTTPVGRLLVDIPLYSGERLQNRNAVIFDLALAVLLGFFVDDLIGARRRPRELRRTSLAPLGTLPRRFFAVLPIFGCLGLIALAYLHPKGLQQRFGVAHPTEDLFKQLAPYLGVTIALAAAVGLFALFAHLLSHRSRIVLVTLLVCADTGVYVANASYGSAPSALLAGATNMSAQLATLTTGGRFALYNPLGIGAPGAVSVGEPDLNILRGLPSVQGYGSIVSGTYQNATSTHNFESLAPAVLDNGLADTLDLRVLLTLPAYLDRPIPPHSAIPVAGAPPVTATGLPGPTSDAPSPAPLASGPWTVGADGERTWFLPSVSSVLRVAVVVNKSDGRRPTTLEVGLGRSGRPTTFTDLPVVNGQAHLTPVRPGRTESVIVRDPSGEAVTIGAVVAVTASPDERLLLDGSLQGALTSPQWSYEEMLGPFTVFLNDDASGLAWLQPATSHSPEMTPRAGGTVTTTANATRGSEEMIVNAPRAELLVRSVAYQPGWIAELTPVKGGSVRSLPVESLGLIQAVHIPAGRYRVSWLYASRGLVVGGALTVGSIAIFALVTVLTVVRRRRKNAGASSSDEVY